MTIWPFTNSSVPQTPDEWRAEASKQRKRADDNHKRWESAEATLVMVRQERDRAKAEVAKLTDALNDKFPPTLPRAEPMVVAGCSTGCGAGTLAGDCLIAHLRQQNGVLLRTWTEGGSYEQ